MTLPSQFTHSLHEALQRQYPEEPWHSRDSSQSTTASSISSLAAMTTLANSASSLSSASTTYDHQAMDVAPLSTHKKAWPHLPDVAEEPIERDYQEDLSTDLYQNINAPSPTSRSSNDYNTEFSNDIYNFDSDYHYDFSDAEAAATHQAKRRRSSDSFFNGIASRMVQRIPSFARRSRGDRKRSSTSMSNHRPELMTSPTLGSRPASFALSSNRPSIDEFAGNTEFDRHGLSYSSEANIDETSYEVIAEQRHELGPLEEAVEPSLQASTPLLHPLMDSLPDEPPVQSPLQSPTIATQSRSVSICNTPADTPYIASQITPPLSTKPSVSSVNRSRTGTLIPSSEIPPIMIAENDDPWSDKLGHANFQIYPEPYLPVERTFDACKQLLKDWGIARTEFSRHLARTETHFGANSRMYRLTEEKWAEIEMNWRISHETAVRYAQQNGDSPPPDLTTQAPASCPRVPIMHASCYEAKFPNLGDTDIIGPMDQAPPPSATIAGGSTGGSGTTIKRRASRRASFKRFLSQSLSSLPSGIKPSKS